MFIYLRHINGTSLFTLGSSSRGPKNSRTVIKMEFVNSSNMLDQIRKAIENRKIGKKYELTRRDWLWFNVNWEKYIVACSEPQYLDSEGINTFSMPIGKTELKEFKESEKIRDYKKYHTGFKSIVIPFGKYKGKKLWTTIAKDRPYFEWLASNRDGGGNDEFFNAVYEKLGVKPPSNSVAQKPKDRLYSVAVTGVIFQSESYGILRIKPVNGVSVVKVVSSDIPKALKTVRYDFSGRFERNEKYGKQFLATDWHRTPKQKSSAEIRAIREASAARRYI